LGNEHVRIQAKGSSELARITIGIFHTDRPANIHFFKSYSIMLLSRLSNSTSWK